MATRAAAARVRRARSAAEAAPWSFRVCALLTWSGSGLPCCLRLDSGLRARVTCGEGLRRRRSCRRSRMGEGVRLRLPPLGGDLGSGEVEGQTGRRKQEALTGSAAELLCPARRGGCKCDRDRGSLLFLLPARLLGPSSYSLWKCGHQNATLNYMEACLNAQKINEEQNLVCVNLGA